LKATRPAQADGSSVVMTDDGFDAIPIRQTAGVIHSYWRPSLGERLRIIFGGHVRLGVFGTQHPPVSVDTLS